MQVNNIKIIIHLKCDSTLLFGSESGDHKILS